MEGAVFFQLVGDGKQVLIDGVETDTVPQSVEHFHFLTIDLPHFDPFALSELHHHHHGQLAGKNQALIVSDTLAVGQCAFGVDGPVGEGKLWSRLMSWM